MVKLLSVSSKPSSPEIFSDKNKTTGEKMEKKLKRGAKARGLTRGAVVAALYIAMSYISHLFGLSNGVIQLRLSEMLCILPVLMPEAIAGLTIGCVLSNILSGCVILDVVFGALATLIGAVCAYMLRRIPRQLIWLATLPNLISNTLIIPAVLVTAYGTELGYPILMLTVGIGEAICGCVLGTVLYCTIRKNRLMGTS